MSTTSPGTANVYARALFEAAGSSAPAVASDLAQLADAIAEGEGAQGWEQLLAPQVPSEVRKSTLDSWLGDANPLTRNFLRVLVDKRRLQDLPAIWEAFRALVQGAESQLDVHITTAIELNEQLRGALEERLSSSTGKQVSLHTSVDPAIIGGLVVQHGDTLVDTSLRSRLDQLRLQLSRPATHSSTTDNQS